MGEIILVRHGQANSAATDEEGYDRLSELGTTQAEWLGAWMQGAGWHFDHVVSGTMRRHRQTVAAMGLSADEDARLNEIGYFGLSEEMHRRHGVPLPGPDDFADHMPRVLAAWAAAEIEGSETFETYESRVAELMAEAAVPGRRILCVTSGGVIGMVLRQILGLDLARLAHVMLPIYNTSLHRLQVRPHGVVMAGFNATPHLEAADRGHAMTYY